MMPNGQEQNEKKKIHKGKKTDDLRVLFLFKSDLPGPKLGIGEGGGAVQT